MKTIWNILEELARMNARRLDSVTFNPGDRQ
jgi:hypothetical protein